MKTAVFRTLRRHRIVHVLAFTMQLCMAWMSVSALVHSDDDDPLCNPVLVLHDHNAHHIGSAPGSSSQPDHCFICHNLTLRSLVASATTVMADVAGQSFATASQVVAGVTLVARRPARAPPLA